MQDRCVLGHHLNFLDEADDSNCEHESIMEWELVYSLAIYSRLEEVEAGSQGVD